ncbi:family 16 glycosylhydrolase [Gilvibacter sp. SZ-19]|uniref:glycoside hydrolase family 16 protein n=1 Tax=unclassified Gilvibacter TaxID=2625242 RepID=UPI000B3CD0E4|nr:glycoside hydrolase family 16 protein [Gilvibacter sp. SZ-19]ARV13089.1 hypothetical protein BTO09_12350 [Gilvibacter sp. SZ-19]
MKRIYQLFFIITVILGVQGCQEDDKVFGDVTAPTNLQVELTVASDQSGVVSVLPSADNAINFHVFFEPDADPVVVSNGQEATFRYIEVGQYTRDIVVVAFGRGGASSSLQLTAELDVILVLDPDVQFALAGDGSKTWVWDSANGGHFGVGAPDVDFANFFSAAPNQLDPCLYDDTITFSFDGAGGFFYTLDPGAETFINWTEIKRFFPEANPGQFVDECRDISDQIELSTNFSLIESDGTTTLTVPGSTLSYYAGITEYEIVELTENKLVVRGIQNPFDPPGDPLAWYHTFVPESGGGDPGCAGGSTGATGSGNNDVLVWADEFDTPGAPCEANWTFEIGDGCPDLCGWGNGEAQYYTDRPENAIVEDGVLKITARAEAFEGSNYTSARMITKDKFEFQYGRVEMRAKLPTGAGTWPAFWMLGADIDTNPWPGAGEMDIMEHVGNSQDVIFNSLHFPGNSGGDAITVDTPLPGASDDFNIYALEWTEDQITFYVNDTVGLSFPNSESVPFQKDFFLLVNVAMGGTFGGAIDPAFTESTFEIDYIRVYQ